MTTTYTRRSLLTRTAATLLAVTLTLTLPGRSIGADPPRSTPPEIDAKWKPLADEYAKVAQLEALAALANKADPKKHPLPNPTPFQKAVAAMADKAKPAARKRASDAASKLMALPVAQLSQKMDLPKGLAPDGKTTPQERLDKMVAARKPAITRAMLDAAAGGDFVKEVQQVKKASGAAPKPNAVKTIRLELLEMHCVDLTSGPGDDEIRIGGTAIKVNSKSGKMSSTFLGEFADNQKKTYNPPKKLYDFDLTLTNGYPKSGGFILVLAEEDFGDVHQEAIGALTDLVKKKIKAELDGVAKDLGKEVAELMASEEFGEVFGETVGNVFAAVINVVFGWLAELWEDDLFVPIHIGFKVTKPEVWANGATHGAEKNYWVKGHGGHYKFKVRFAKVN